MRNSAYNLACFLCFLVQKMVGSYETKELWRPTPKNGPFETIETMEAFW